MVHIFTEQEGKPLEVSPRIALELCQPYLRLQIKTGKENRPVPDVPAEPAAARATPPEKKRVETKRKRGDARRGLEEVG